MVCAGRASAQDGPPGHLSSQLFHIKNKSFLHSWHTFHAPLPSTRIPSHSCANFQFLLWASSREEKQDFSFTRRLPLPEMFFPGWGKERSCCPWSGNAPALKTFCDCSCSQLLGGIHQLLDVTDKRRGQTSWSGSSVWNFSESLPESRSKNRTPPAGSALISHHCICFT